MFPIKNLPAEIRDMIYPHALAIQHDNQAPPLLVALAADKELYVQAQKIYRQVNIHVSAKNEEAFKMERLSKMLKYNHIKLVCSVK